MENEIIKIALIKRVLFYWRYEMKEANRKQKKLMAELDHKVSEYYKTHDEERDELYRMQAHYHKKIKEAGQ